MKSKIEVTDYDFFKSQVNSRMLHIIYINILLIHRYV